MPDMDSTEVKILARRLELAPKMVMPALLPVAHRAGNKLKSVLRSDAAGHRGMPGVAGGISYEIQTKPGEIAVEAGWFAPKGQQHLENILVFGTDRMGPRMDITRGPRSEAPIMARHLAQVAAKVLL